MKKFLAFILYATTILIVGCGGDSRKIAPAVMISASPVSIQVGQSATVTWSSTDATSCSASGAWNGSQPTSGTFTAMPSATGTSTYTLTCTGAGGSGSGSATLTVTSPPVPAVTLSISPASIILGQSATLTWSSTNATSCTASGDWSGPQSTSGTSTQTPVVAGTSTYTLTCAGPGGSASGSAALTVTPPAPTVIVSANPATLALGQTTALTWNSTNATSCTASAAWGGLQPISGSSTETPAAAGTSTYTLTCTGPGGAGSASAAVTVTPPVPTVTIAASPSSITLGQPSTLTWSSSNATSCTASGSWSGDQSTSGTAAETPAATGTSTYTLACTGAGGTGTSSATVNVAAAVAHFTSGTQTTLVGPMSIDANGGTLTAPAGSALDGVTVSFPAGALSDTRQISLKSDDGALTVADGTPSGKVLVLDLGTSVQFQQPVHITIPYAGDRLPVPYYVDGNGNLHVAQLSSLDAAHHTAVFDTFHASIFTWILAELGATDSYATNFGAGHDDFQVANYGSDFGRNGECFGMSSFALWYYENAKPGGGEFFPRFMNSLGTDSSGRPRFGQNVIATRAFTSIVQQWNTYVGSVIGPEIGMTPSQNYTVIRNALLNTQNPVILYLNQSQGSSAHSVLATAYDQGSISVYDVNFPGVVHTIVYDPVAQTFQPYLSAENAGAAGNTYDGIYYNGDGSLYVTEPYQNILDQANQNFASSLNATINIDSPANGDVETTRVLTMTGNIVSSQVLVDKLKVLVGSTEFTTNVNPSGGFSITLTIDKGINHLVFTTQGKEADSAGIYVDKDVPNNYANQDFILTGNVPDSVIYTTLTWDTNDTDIDTYVIDPTGDYSAYYHKQTADGGFLDFDITTGYGPEHWLLTTANTVRYGEDYKMRLHYYSDHGNGPSNYTVTIQLYDGDRAITTYYRGNLAANDPANDAPNGTGADWADIATITPVQQPTGQATRAPLIRREGRGQPVHITVFVPPPSERVKMK